MTFEEIPQADGMIDGWGDANYYVAVDGALARYVDQEMGFVLDNGLLLATSLVNSDETWRITLSVRKPTGAMSLASLQGPYWLIRYQYNNVGGADQHAISLGEAYFDGGGRAGRLDHLERQGLWRGRRIHRAELHRGRGRRLFPGQLCRGRGDITAG